MEPLHRKSHRQQDIDADSFDMDIRSGARCFFAVLLYIILRTIKKHSSIHLIRFESYIRTGLIIVGAFGAFSLGANNIANVIGVFVPAFNLQDLNLGLFSLSSAQQLFLLGGLAIAAGILTYSKKVMETVGSNIVELSSEAALVTVLAQAMVLFIFSSSWFSSYFSKLASLLFQWYRYLLRR